VLASFGGRASTEGPRNMSVQSQEEKNSVPYVGRKSYLRREGRRMPEKGLGKKGEVGSPTEYRKFLLSPVSLSKRTKACPASK